jgi:uncharacterized protein YrrD
MKKQMHFAVLISVISLGLLAATAYAGGPMTKGDYQAFDMNATLGSLVKNPQGDYLGRIDDYVFDSEGRITFAVLSYGGWWRMVGGKHIAIPFDAFSYEAKDRQFVLDATREQLDTAPVFDKKFVGDRKWAEDTYRFFGRQPYWTEGGE